MIWTLGIIQSLYTLAYELLPPLQLFEIPLEFKGVVAICIANALICVICGVWCHLIRGSWHVGLGSTQPITARGQTLARLGIAVYVGVIGVLGLIYYDHASSSPQGTALNFSSLAEMSLFILAIPVCEEIFFRGYLRVGLYSLWIKVWYLVWPTTTHTLYLRKNWAYWGACLIFIVCHPLPFLSSNLEFLTHPQWTIPWGVVLLSVTCEALRQFGYSTLLTITIHIIANSSVYYFKSLAPEFLSQWRWLFL